MDEKTMELVGIAASIAGHCRPCFLYHFKQAEKLGVTIDDIKEVVELANRISTSGDKAMYDFVYKQLKKKRGE
ncbi:MAG: carboxymuconolactone decarboxylase family protein [Candidatus Thermoplasmatota archaeon]